MSEVAGMGVPVSAAAVEEADTGTPSTHTRDGWTTTPELDQLTDALVDALGELQDVPRSRTANAGTYKYAYADLGDAFAQVRPVFKKHGLGIDHDIATVDGDVVVRAVVLHKSGQRLVGSPLRLPAGNTAQNMGSALTYARRYTLMAITGLATEDDDGASAGTRDMQLMSAENVDRFLDAAHDALLTAEEITEVVMQATQGRTGDPKLLWKSEVAPLRDALAAAASQPSQSDRGVSEPSGGGPRVATDPPPDTPLPLDGSDG